MPSKQSEEGVRAPEAHGQGRGVKKECQFIVVHVSSITSSDTNETTCVESVFEIQYVVHGSEKSKPGFHTSNIVLNIRNY